MIKILQQSYNPKYFVAIYIAIEAVVKSIIKSFITNFVSPAPFIAEENIILKDSNRENTAINLNNIIIVGLICSIIKRSEPLTNGFTRRFGISKNIKNVKMIKIKTI